MLDLIPLGGFCGFCGRVATRAHATHRRKWSGTARAIIEVAALLSSAPAGRAADAYGLASVHLLDGASPSAVPAGGPRLVVLSEAGSAVAAVRMLVACVPSVPRHSAASRAATRASASVAPCGQSTSSGHGQMQSQWSAITGSRQYWAVAVLSPYASRTRWRRQPRVAGSVRSGRSPSRRARCTGLGAPRHQSAERPG